MYDIAVLSILRVLNELNLPLKKAGNSQKM